MKNSIYFTAGEFAGLHHINKRTLHYYDDIGLLSPAYKGENGYRYYSYRQSVQLESILFLRRLNLPIETVRNYIASPNGESFYGLSVDRLREIDRQIEELELMKQILSEKNSMLDACKDAHHGSMEMISCKRRRLLITMIQEDEEADLIRHLQKTEEILSYKKICGSRLPFNCLKNREWDAYDAYFTELDDAKTKEKVCTLTAGTYLRTYCIGEWDKLPSVYENLMAYAKAHSLELYGYAYERGLNDIAVGAMEDYVTEIIIPCKEKVPTDGI